MGCDFICVVYIGEIDGESQYKKFNCANEAKHSGNGHLIIVTNEDML